MTAPRSKLRWTGLRSHQGGTNSLSVRVAAALGVSRHKAEGLLWGPLNLAHMCALVIRTLRDAGADVALTRFLVPLDLAIHAATPEQLRPELLLTEQEDDGAEDLAESAYLLCPDRAHAEAFVRRLDKATASAARLRAAIAAKYGLQ